MNNNRIPVELQQARDSEEEAKKGVDEAQTNVDTAKEKFSIWKDGKMFLAEEFKQHGINCVAPGFTYFAQKFIEPNGPYYNVYQAYHAASLFNPLKIRGKSLAFMEALIDKLHHFKCSEMDRPAFLVLVKRELPFYISILEGIQEEYWSTLVGAAEYDKKAALKRQKEANDPSDHNLETYYDRTAWKDDEAEVARRAWEWWKVHKGTLPKLALCVRLVVLVQVSSASVDDALLLRLFSRVNKDYYKRS